MRENNKSEKAGLSWFYRGNFGGFPIEMEGGREVGVLLDLSEGSPLYIENCYQ